MDDYDYHDDAEWCLTSLYFYNKRNSFVKISFEAFKNNSGYLFLFSPYFFLLFFFFSVHLYTSTLLHVFPVMHLRMLMTNTPFCFSITCFVFSFFPVNFTFTIILTCQLVSISSICLFHFIFLLCLINVCMFLLIESSKADKIKFWALLLDKSLSCSKLSWDCFQYRNFLSV